jgi:hypothetical protein
MARSGERAYFKRHDPNMPNICICRKEIGSQNAMIRHCGSHDHKNVVPNYRAISSFVEDIAGMVDLVAEVEHTRELRGHHSVQSAIQVSRQCPLTSWMNLK